MARNIVRFNPFAELEALQRQFFGDDAFAPVRGVNIPTTDVYLKGQQLVIEAHLPNFEEKDVQINLDEGALSIQAQHRQRQEEDRRYIVRESSSSFYRRIALPERADEGAISATFDNGVLTVTVPIKEQAAPKTIGINTGGSASGAAGGGSADASGSASGAAQAPAGTSGSSSSEGTAATDDAGMPSVPSPS